MKTRSRSKTPVPLKQATRTLSRTTSNFPNPDFPILASWYCKDAQGQRIPSFGGKLKGYVDAIDDQALHSGDSLCTRESGSFVIKPAYEQMIIAMALWPILPEPSYAKRWDNVINVVVPMVRAILTTLPNLNLSWLLDDGYSRCRCWPSFDNLLHP
jgi:hypothetical protein